MEAEDTVMEFIDNFHNLYHEDFCIQGEIECKESSVIAVSLSLVWTMKMYTVFFQSTYGI